MLNACGPEFVEKLRAAGVKLRAATPAYHEEPRGAFQGLGAWVALPQSTYQVAALIKLANSHRVGIVPFGGGTGLVGGQVKPEGPPPLIVSFEAMKAIRAVHTGENAIIVDSGTTLRDIQTAAEQAGRLFPLSYASQDSAQIGGALAVNSGGLNVLRYGTARDLCLGLEAVLPNGDVFHGLKRLRKDNTGYDLRHLLIGAEGTLGLITAAALKLFPRPSRRATAFLAVPSPAAALELLSLFYDRAGETVSAYELISGQAFAFLAETMPDIRLPFAQAPDWCVLVELGTGEETDPNAVLVETFELATERGLTSDGHVAQSAQQRAAFWAVRENIPQANRRIGAIASHDIALPQSEIPGFLKEMERELTALLPCRINAFGHLGDGNLHYNIFPAMGAQKSDHIDRAPEISQRIHDRVVAMGGTFSAEHGIGRLKTGELQRLGDPAKLAAMRAVKDALDPNGIMNPGAVLYRPST